jgi:hypothetical protein
MYAQLTAAAGTSGLFTLSASGLIIEDLYVRIRNLKYDSR